MNKVNIDAILGKADLVKLHEKIGVVIIVGIGKRFWNIYKTINSLNELIIVKASIKFKQVFERININGIDKHLKCSNS